MKQVYFTLILIFTSVNVLLAQDKQGNTANAEIYADAPYRMKYADENGNINPIPIHIFAHDADGFGANIELMSIDIYVKNAQDNNYTQILTFDDYTTEEFNNLFIHKSVGNSNLDVQDFESSMYQKSSSHTIVFKETHDYLDGEDYVEIKRKFWYFTFIIPGEKLAGYDSIIDIKVYFNIDWSVDDETNLRVFRYATDVPKIKDWYRGDTHYHTIFTQNIAETGEALSATRYFGKLTGLDWQFTSDHSCDFDNYGTGMQENWNELGSEIYYLNTIDTDYVMIRGIEMSINNNGGKVVHALTYPSYEDPFSMPYVGDGGGDSHETNVNTDMLLDSVIKYKGMVFAAHPFAEDDKLPDLINGSVWNISDPDFLPNGSPMPSYGNVICNDLSMPSDVFDDDPGKLFKDGLYGFQIWNLYNSLTTTDNDNFGDPYNATNDEDLGSISQLPVTDSYHHLYRLSQNFDVIKFLWKKALQEKNENPDLENWKTFIIAGSDAHGSFNYSTTDMYYATYGTIEDNAIGRLSTLVFLPDGKGQNGTNILKALKQGHAVLSDGPVITFLLKSDNHIYTCGDDIEIEYSDLDNFELELLSKTTYEYGSKNKIIMTIGTDNGEFNYPVYDMSDTVSFNLFDLLNGIFLGNIPEDKYFYIRFMLETYRDYGNKASIYKKSEENFYSFTNPVWIKVKNTVSTQNEEVTNENIRTEINGNTITLTHNGLDISHTVITDLSGRQLSVPVSEYENKTIINTSTLPSGIYLVRMTATNGEIIVKKIPVAK